MAERCRGGVLAACLLALCLPALAGCAGTAGGATGEATGPAAVVSGTADDGWNGVRLDAPFAVPDTTLIDTSGEPVALGDALGEGQRLTLVFFGYTHCPDICQAVMADLASTVARLSEDDADEVRVWFVTTDPARDDPDTLRAYLDRFDPSFEGFTGSLPDIVALATAVHVPIEKGPRLPTGGYEVTHGTPVLGVTPDGQVPLLWTEGTSAARLAEDVTRFLAEG